MGVKRTVYNWEEREGEGESERERARARERKRESEQEGSKDVLLEETAQSGFTFSPLSLGKIVSPVHIHRYYQE